MPVIALEDAQVVFGTRAVLDGVTLGVEPGDRIGVVGRNGDGKSTLLRVLSGDQELHGGRRISAPGLQVVLVAQSDELVGQATTVGQAVVGSAPEHTWAADPRVRAVLAGLLGGVRAEGYSRGLQTPLAGLSGGELRRVALARALVDPGDLLALDEPTNHLDLHAIKWLAEYLTGPNRPPALVVVTHDRWFLDEVALNTWEVVAGSVVRFDGGYAAWVLARAERDRRASVAEDRRRNAVRKELAWLRRGPPARTSKPAFRIAAANALIADVPEPRDSVALRKLAAARLGRRVVDIESVTLSVPAAAGQPRRVLFADLDWQIGPGDRIGLVGPNGAGKTTLVRLLLGQIQPDSGKVVQGATVVPALLGQVLDVSEPDDRVLPNLERLRREFEVGGRTVTATNLLDEFGFRGGRAMTRLGELSGGELRRFELLKLLLGSPNLLVLDEPTNDLDVDTLGVIEDALDTWPGTLVVISHDRYFLERNCDQIFAVPGDGRLVHLPAGIDSYLAGDLPGAGPIHPKAAPTKVAPAPQPVAAGEPAQGPTLSGAALHAARKELARIESRIDRLGAAQLDLHEQMAAAATDHQALGRLGRELSEIQAEQEELEGRWLELAEALPG